MNEYTITLTDDEIEILKDAINYQDVFKYHRKIDNAKKSGDKVAEKFWTDEWYKSIDLFVKLVRTNRK